MIQSVFYKIRQGETPFYANVIYGSGVAKHIKDITEE